jgi:hypothetical protein
LKLRRKNISMLHLSTGIVAQNKVHATTEWGAAKTESNGVANEEICDRNGINHRVYVRRRRGRYADPSAATADPGGRKGSNRQDANW